MKKVHGKSFKSEKPKKNSSKSISVEGRCKKILQEELTCQGADVENFVHGTLERHKTEIMESCLSEGITEVA